MLVQPASPVRGARRTSSRRTVHVVAICALSLGLFALQASLYAHRDTWSFSAPERMRSAWTNATLARLASSVAFGGAGSAAAPAAVEPAAAATAAAAATTTARPQTAAALREVWAASNRSNGSKFCGSEATDLPHNRILIIHEQHLQSMGCDVRLLRFIKDLVYLNQEVSMLFRGSTPQHMRQPKSKQLASILHIDDFEEDQLRKGLRPPPGLYEWTTAERFAQLIALGHFNIVIVFLWFWYDPQPSAAELMLPLVRAHAPKDRQPFVALLSDDAHAIRASRLGEVEIHVSTREGYNDRARNYWIREKNLYRLADMAMHISGMDQVGGCATTSTSTSTSTSAATTSTTSTSTTSTSTTPTPTATHRSPRRKRIRSSATST